MSPTGTRPHHRRRTRRRRDRRPPADGPRPRRPGRGRRARRAPRAPTGWPRPAGTSPWSRRRSSPGRRPAATGSPPGPCARSPTWASRAPWPAPTATAGSGPTPSAGCSTCPGPSTPPSPPTATSSPATTSTPWSTSGRPRPAPPCSRAPRRSSRSSTTRRRPPAGAGLPVVRGRRGQGQGHRRASARSGPATWWWPTGPTRASAGRSARAGTGPSPWAWPSAATTRSPGHDQPFIESHLDIRDGEGNVVPGYGWIFPLGDGRVNVGVGLLSTDRRWKGVNTGTLMEHFVAWAPKEWELSPATAPRARRPAASCRWACPSAPGWAPPPWWWATPPGPSTRSTARASPTATRPAAWPRRRWARPCPATGSTRCCATRTGSRTPTASTTGWPGPSSGSSPGPS